MGRKRGNGEGTVYQRADGRWTAQLTVGRDPVTTRPVRKTVYGNTQRECLDKLDALKDEARQGIVADATTMTVWQLLDLWLTGHKVRVEESTYGCYCRRIGLLRPYTEGLPLARLNGLAVVQIYRGMEAAGVSASDRNLAGKLLRQALTWAVGLDFIRRNVALQVPLPRVVRQEVRPLDETQVRSLLASTASDRLHALYVVALDSGAREGELWCLEWPDWSEDNVLAVVKTLSPVPGGGVKVKAPKTRKGRRLVPLGNVSRSALHEHREKMREEGHQSRLIFPDRHGRFLTRGNYLTHEWAAVTAAAGLSPETRFHDLRHTCATLLLKAGVNIKVVSERLGHSSVVITLNTYAHVMPGMQEAAARVMDGVFGAESPSQ